MDRQIEEYVALIHDREVGMVLVTAGGASQVAAWLLGVPGASRTILEAVVPYSPSALCSFAPGLRGGAVSDERAVALADRAWERAVQLGHRDREAMGVACTAALSTDRDRRGDDRAHICIRRAGERIACHVPLKKTPGSRSEQEEQLSWTLLALIGRAVGIQDPALNVELPDVSRTPVGHPYEEVRNGTLGWALVHRDGQWVAGADSAPVLFPGSFDPLHRGHERLARAVGAHLGTSVDLELSIENTDKPTLSQSETDRRLSEIQGRFRVVVTREPTFLGKARLFPGRTFVVGYDTAARLIDPQYYGDEAGRDAAMEEMRALGCRCVVGGRMDEERFLTLDDLPLPLSAKDLFEAISADVFREDISATEIRMAKGTNQERG